jgi:shikimate kinase
LEADAGGSGAVSSGPTRNIALIGMMGSGKSTVGRLLAERLGWTLIDTDERIVAEVGKPIADIFRDDGEPAFRAIEARVVAVASEEREAVIALGGGAILREDSRDRLWSNGGVVWLSASPEENEARAAQSERRPLLEGHADRVEAARTILRQREPLYALAHWKEDTSGRTPEEIATSLERQWRLRFE